MHETPRSEPDALADDAGVPGSLPTLAELVDAADLQPLMANFSALTNLPVALEDLEGHILVGTGFNDICTRFHRVHPETRAHCLESDTVLTRGVPRGESRAYQCRNGLSDVVTPLFVGDTHVGNLFTGQFFFDDEGVDIDFFERQADRHGFDHDDYMSALRAVPTFSRTKVDALMRFYARFTEQIMKVIYSNRLLSNEVERRERAEDEIRRLNKDLERRVQERTEELVATNEELVEATTAKSAFLASMSHELRTPLNSIIGFSSVLAQGLAGPLTDEQHTQIGMVRSSGRHLLSLIEGVLDLAKVESGAVELTVEPVDACALVREVVESVRPLAEEKGLVLEVEAKECHLGLVTDAVKLKQVLFNLMGNAVKFTREGAVRATVRCAPHEGWTFVVSDTGPGIAAADTLRVFDAYTQLQTEGMAKPQGTGLGLHISREYAWLLGGDITVTSEVGTGSTFTLTLPEKPPGHLTPIEGSRT